MSKSTIMSGSVRRIGREMLTALTTAFREAAQPTDPYADASSDQIMMYHEPFQYAPLTSASSFRILQLSLVHSPNNGPGLLRGSLVEASFEDYPEYHALSYTWGDPTPTELVLLDGKYLGITANCAAALRRLMRGKGGMLIWVDSICINQAETPAALDERSKQVASMDLIYRNAVQVDVHLGEGDAASDTACEAIKRLFAYFTGAIVPGPQQNFCRKRYESVADDVLGKYSLRLLQYSQCLRQLRSDDTRISVRQVTWSIPFAMVQTYLGTFNVPLDLPSLTITGCTGSCVWRQRPDVLRQTGIALQASGLGSGVRTSFTFEARRKPVESTLENIPRIP